LKPTKIKITQDWTRLGIEYKEFYEKLDELIRKEYSITEVLKKDEIDKVLEDFLKNCDSHLNLPKYSKALVERIIFELNNK
ncbi:hypothetical protein, partial [Streptococcus pneumoniae]|uniref:hypothetical protein n=1 Tax=Streptococcus pneumoniae TaxID=1313 RepID=UPI001E621F4C